MTLAPTLAVDSWSFTAMDSLAMELAGSARSARVLVTGSRDWNEFEVVSTILDGLLDLFDGRMVLVHGDCPTGADAQAEEWARWQRLRGRSVRSERHPADWDRFGRQAGYIRNSEMVKLGADLCLGFILNNSNGASHTVKLARKAGITTQTFRRTVMPQPYRRVEDEITLRDVQMVWKNFRGEERQFNAAGNRNFSIVLDKPMADKLSEIGWNVKPMSRNENLEEGAEPLFHLPVKVNFEKGTPPRLFMVTVRGRTKLDAETCGLLDFARFDRVDLTLSPYNWDVSGNRGVTAYLRTGYFQIHEDPLDIEYADIPDADAPKALPSGDVIDGESTDWMVEQETPALPSGS